MEKNQDKYSLSSESTPDIIGCIPLEVQDNPERKRQNKNLEHIDLVESICGIDIEERNSHSPSLLANASFQQGIEKHQKSNGIHSELIDLTENFSDFLRKETQREVCTQSIPSQRLCEDSYSPQSVSLIAVSTSTRKRLSTKRRSITGLEYASENKKSRSTASKNDKVNKNKMSSHSAREIMDHQVLSSDINPNEREISEFKMLLIIKGSLTKLEEKFKKGIGVDYVAALNHIVGLLKHVNSHQILEYKNSPGSTFHFRRIKLEKLFLLHCTLLADVNQRKHRTPPEEMMDHQSTDSVCVSPLQVPETPSFHNFVENAPNENNWNSATCSKKVNGMNWSNVKFRKAQKNEWIAIPANELKSVQKQFTNERVFHNTTIPQNVWDEIDDWS